MSARGLTKTIFYWAAALAALALVCFPLTAWSCTPPARYAITILHTNDTHAHLDNAARFATMVEQIRGQSGKDSTMLFHSGDVFVGTPYYTMYYGTADLWFMDYVKYDAMCPGNHEFDDGPTHFADFAGKAGFPILCSNLIFPGDSRFSGKIAPTAIIERGGTRYGVFGLDTEETVSISNPGPTAKFRDHIADAGSAIAYFQGLGINKIIALTHIGWDEDIELAQKVPGIDIILGGHSHTVPAQYPTVITASGAPVLVLQAGCFNAYLGKLNVVFDGDGIIQGYDGSRLIPVDNTTAEDPACAARLSEYRTPLQEYEQTTLGETLVDLDGERERVRVQETNLGDLVADAMLKKASCVKADMAIINSGNIRTSIKSGTVRLWDVMNTLPFNNYLECVDLTGTQVAAALENGVSQVEGVKGRFPQVSGLRFRWDPLQPPGRRITGIDVLSSGVYGPIDAGHVYRIAANDYMVNGGDDFTVMKDGTNINNLGFMLYEVVAEHVKQNSPLRPSTDGRITRLGAQGQ